MHSAGDPGSGRGFRLLIISADYPPTRSPEAAHAYHLADQFARRGSEVSVLTTATGRGFVPQGVSVDRAMPSWSWKHLPRFAAALRRFRPDGVLLVYLDTMYDHHPMITFAPTVARRATPGTPFVTQFENLGMADTSSRVASGIRKLVRTYLMGAGSDYSYGTLLRDSHRVIVLSERHRTGLVSHDPAVASRSVLIPPAPIMVMVPAGDQVQRQLDREKLGLGPQDLAFCYFGYIYAGKGMETMLHAFARVSERHPSARLVIIGGFAQHSFDREFADRSRTYESTIQGLATVLDLQRKIAWVGHCPPTESGGSRYLRASDVYILPVDRGVCLNNSALGAGAAHGLPILTTAGPETEPQILEGGHVLSCPPKDVAAMAHAMERLILEPDLRSRLALGSETLTRELFDWDTVVRRIQAAFAE